MACYRCLSHTLRTLACLILSGGTLWAVPSYSFPVETVMLQGLDKVTARISTFYAPIDKEVNFGALRIMVRHCDRSPPEEPPESKAFLEIVEVHKGSGPETLFTGWMFASSPALSAMEHPVYDVWVKECIDGPPPETVPAETSPSKTEGADGAKGTNG